MSRKTKKKRAASKGATEVLPQTPARDPIREWSDNLIFAGTLLILFFRPFLCGRTYPQYNHLFHIGVALLAAVWLVKCWRKRVLELHNRLVTGFMFAFLLVCTLTIFTTVNKGITLRYIYEILSYTLLYLIIANNFRDKSWVKAAVVVLIASGLLVNIYGLFQRYYTLEITRRYVQDALKSGDPDALNGVPFGTALLNRLESTRVFSTFLYPNAYALYLGMLGGVMIGWVWSMHRGMIQFAKESLKSLSRPTSSPAGNSVDQVAPKQSLGQTSSPARNSKVEKYVALVLRLLRRLAAIASPFLRGAGGLLLLLLFVVACVVIPWDLWMTYSRGGMGSAIAVVLVLVAVRLWGKAPRTKAAALVLALIVFANVVTAAHATESKPAHNVSFLSRLQDSKSVAQRLSYWKATLGMIKDYPLLGIGWGAFESAYPRYFILGGYPVKLAHNNYLQVWAETGIVGLNAFVGIWLVFLYTFWRKVRPGAADDLRGIACGLGAGIIGFLVNSLVDFGLYLPTLSYLVFAFLGLLVAVPTDDEADKFSLRFPTLAAASMVALILIYVLFLFRSFFALNLFTVAESERNSAFPTLFAMRKGRYQQDPELQLRTLMNVIPMLKKSTEYFPLDADAHHMLADTYLRLADMKQEPSLLNEAIKEMQQATELNPLSSSAFQSLAATYWIAGNVTARPELFQKALQAQRKASQNFPVNPTYHEKLAEMYKALGLMKEQQEETQLAAELRRHYKEY